MDETKATEANAETIAPQEPTLAPGEDHELEIAALEAEKTKLIEERDNYKNAYLKEANKHKEPENESDDERIRRIARETVAENRIAEIDKQKEELLAKTLKENKELKLAQLNKPTATSAAMGGHTEGPAVTDTLVTPEQLAYFKSRGWSDKDIERFKQNLRKNSR